MLIVLSGLPGSGKSATAEGLARLLPAAVLSVDPIEAAIWRCGIPPSHETGVAAYEVAATLAEVNLRLGQSVIADAVNSLEIARDQWRRAAHRAGAPMRVLEVVCSDADLHRRRLAARTREIEGFPEPTWADVTARRDEWEPWPEDHLVLDSTAPLPHNLELALTHIRR